MLFYLLTCVSIWTTVSNWSQNSERRLVAVCFAHCSSTTGMHKPQTQAAGLSAWMRWKERLFYVSLNIFPALIQCFYRSIILWTAVSHHIIQPTTERPPSLDGGGAGGQERGESMAGTTKKTYNTHWVCHAGNFSLLDLYPYSSLQSEIKVL